MLQNRLVIKLNGDKIDSLVERKKDVVLKSDILLEQTKKSAKNILYLINGFWPNNQEKFYIDEKKDNASKSDIKRLKDAIDVLEELKKELRGNQVLLTAASLDQNP